MNREILFRAKQISDREWVEGDLYRQTGYFGQTKTIIFQDKGCYDMFKKCLVDSDTVCQYTGLKDKNGNKIYENDIVKIDGEEDYFLVEWDSDKARFAMSNKYTIVEFDNYWDCEIEVCDNVFDNPDLLEVVE